MKAPALKLAIDTDAMMVLREEILANVIAFVGADEHETTARALAAATACMGAAACALGILPSQARAEGAAQLSIALLKHADARAAEIRSGEFDMQRHRARS